MSTAAGWFSSPNHLGARAPSWLSGRRPPTVVGMSNPARRQVSRRSLLGWGLAGATAPFVGATFESSSARQSATIGGRLPAKQAEALASAFGVVTHLHFGGSVYGQTQRVVDTVAQLGVRHVRNRLATIPPVLDGFREMAANGTRIEGVCGAFGDPQSMRQILDSVVKAYPDPVAVFSALEGINEPNNDGVPWVAETRSKTMDLFAERRRHGLEAIQIVGPSLARVTGGGVEGGTTQGQSLSLGDLSPWIDRGNIHVYPRARPPSTDLDMFIAWQRAVCANKPIYTTEGGFFTASNYHGGSNPTSEDAVRQYVPREIMENWIRGIERFFLYELLDDPDPSKAQRESNFGMLSVNGIGKTAAWTPKPHYYAMKNFLEILGDPGPEHAVTDLYCTLDGGGAELRTSVVQKRDGTHYLCVWRDVAVYDPKQRKNKAPSLTPVTVSLARPADVTVYAPSTQPQPIATYRGSRQFRLNIGGELLICAIKAGGAASGSIGSVLSTVLRS